MGNVMIIILKTAAAVITGILAGHSVVYMFNRLPAQWLCDYGEEPSEELKDTSVQRIKGYPWKLVMTGFFICVCLHLIFFDWQFCAAGVIYCWALVMIFASDRKYSIIPDQFVILTAVTAAGFIPFYDNAIDHVYGLAAGAGIMLLSAVIGKLIFRKDALGFGDVKLFAALGLVLGLEGVLTVMVISCLSSALVFSVKLIKKSIKKDDMVPLGPYICGAGIFYVVIIWPLL